jgi:hypothetical protein
MMSLNQLLKHLPPQAKKELIDFAEFLNKKYAKTAKKKTLRLNWAGGLQGYDDDIDPVELQHKIADIWGGN